MYYPGGRSTTDIVIFQVLPVWWIYSDNIAVFCHAADCRLAGINNKHEQR